MTKEELQKQIEDLTAKLGGLESGTDEYNQTITALTAAKQQLDQIGAQQQHEDRVQQAVQESQDWIDSVTIADMPISSYFPDPNEFSLFKLEIKQRFADQATRLSQEIVNVQNECQDKLKAAADESAKLQSQLDAKDADLRKSEEDNHNLAGQISQLRLELDDANAKRDNAVSQLEEANQTISQKESHIDDLRKQIALGVGGAIRVVDEAEQAKKAELEKQAKLKRVIYDLKDDGKISPIDYTAKRAIDDEEITFKAVYKNSYTVLNSPEEVKRFRDENGVKEQPTPAAPAVLESNTPVDNGGSSANLPAVATPELSVPTFHQTEVQDGQSGVDGNSAQAQMVGQSPTIEEIDARLKRVEAQLGIAV